MENKLIREKISIELCENFISRLKQEESPEIKLSALIALKNLIKYSQISDPILENCLIDTLTDQDKEIRKFTKDVIRDICSPNIIELLELKLTETSGDIKVELSNFFKELQNMKQVMSIES